MMNNLEPKILSVNYNWTKKLSTLCTMFFVKKVPPYNWIPITVKWFNPYDLFSKSASIDFEEIRLETQPVDIEATAQACMYFRFMY